MFRRSNSSSNIPLPRTRLFSSKETKAESRRSQSTSRLSRRDSATSTSQLRQPRKSSLDRASNNLLGLPKMTPRMSNRPGSLLKTTPTSTLSQRTRSSRSVTPSSCLKDRKTIQKLSTDKKWVSEQYTKVQNFIMTSSLFDLNVVNVNSLKPPTINTFIYITTVLFTEIFPKIKITKENYKEVIPAQLKILQYPGTLANSVLKTVNTQHSWPQVVGMWSWLIDRVNIVNIAEEEICLEFLGPEERQTYLLRKNCWDHLVTRYKIFNSNDDDAEKIRNANETYVNNLADILGVDFDNLRRLKEEVQNKSEYKHKQEVEIENIKTERMRIQSAMEQMQQEINDFNDADAVEEKELDNEIELLQINIEDLNDTNAALKKNINHLEDTLRVQPCTYQEKLKLLRQIDELKDEITMKREKIEHAQAIKNKFDHKLASELDKVRTMVIQWNRSLMEPSIKKPELKKLLFRERGFHDPEFLNEIKQVLDHKVSVESKISKALSKFENDLKMKTEKKQELEKEIEELNRIDDYTKQECSRLSANIEVINKEMKELLSDWDKKKKYHEQQVMEVQEKGTRILDEKTALNSELKNKRDNLELEVNKFGQKMLSFFIELHNQITNNVKEMDVVRREVTQNYEIRLLNMLEKQKQLIEIVKSFNKRP